MLGDVQTRPGSPLRGQQLGQRRVDCVLARLGQLNQYAAPVVGVILPDDEARGRRAGPPGWSSFRR